MREHHFYRETNGALKKKINVMALDLKNEWRVAEILESRQRVYVDSDEDREESKEEPDASEGHHRKKDYEYYCHYLELERRNDRWLTDK